MFSPVLSLAMAGMREYESNSLNRYFSSFHVSLTCHDRNSVYRENQSGFQNKGVWLQCASLCNLMLLWIYSEQEFALLNLKGTWKNFLLNLKEAIHPIKAYFWKFWPCKIRLQ